MIAWDRQGRVFMGSESSDDPAGSLEDLRRRLGGDLRQPGWAERQHAQRRQALSRLDRRGQGLVRAVPARQVQRQDLHRGRPHHWSSEGNVYFAWSRFTGNAGDVSIYFSRSTDHGATWSKPMNLTPNVHDVQFPDIAVTGNGNVYVTFRQIAAQGGQADAVRYVKSTDGGKTFGSPRTITTFTPYDPQDTHVDGSFAGDGGDFANAVQSGYTFFRGRTQVRSTADASADNEKVYIVFDPTKPGTEVDTGTTLRHRRSRRG